MAIQPFDPMQGFNIGRQMAGQGGTASFLSEILDRAKSMDLMNMQIGGQVRLHQALQQIDPEAQFKARLYGALNKQLGAGGLDTSEIGRHLLGLGKSSEQLRREAQAEQEGKFAAGPGPTTPLQEKELELKGEQITSERQKQQQTATPGYKKFFTGTAVPTQPHTQSQIDTYNALRSKGIPIDEAKRQVGF